MAQTFGETLVEARARHEPPLTQDDVAARVGVVQQTISKWELNRRTPRPGMIGDIAAAYEIDAETLLRAAFSFLPKPDDNEK